MTDINTAKQIVAEAELAIKEAEEVLENLEADLDIAMMQHGLGSEKVEYIEYQISVTHEYISSSNDEINNLKKEIKKQNA